ncbi:MAG: hypothetical protein ACRC8Y_22805 [Chroococcales cyanobacterium]
MNWGLITPSLLKLQSSHSGAIATTDTSPLNQLAVRLEADRAGEKS